MAIATVPSTLLRPALEAAVRVARDGEAADPVQPAPASLRRYLRFAKLPTPALDIARRVLDDDDAFRERVAEHTSPQEVGEAAWLWLTRPEGWEARLDAIRRETQAKEQHQREERSERDAQRRLAGAEAAARRAEALAAERARELDEVRQTLSAERARADAVQADVATVRQQMERLTEERAAAVRKLKETESELAHRSADLRHARHQLRMLQAELAIAHDQPPARPSSAPASTASGVKSTPGSSIPAADAGQDDLVDRAALSGAIADAGSSAAQLAEALARAAKLLDHGAAPMGGPGATSATNAPRAGAPSRHRRTPVRLPPGVLDDSVAAAEHLVRAPGVLVVVDGYNVSQSAWPGSAIAEQRRRLIDALSELHARTGAEALVVFDGAETVDGAPAGSPPGVQVRFSPPGIEADDVVIDLVAALPAERPVVVASSDRRVRDGCRGPGANLVSARQFLGALRR